MKTNIPLPKNKGLKEAYISILKMVYFEQIDVFLFSDYVYAVQSDCGVSTQTATNRCKQLSQLSILQYLYLGMSGHSYKCSIYANDGEKISYIDNLPEASRLIEAQFPDVMETEFLKIKKMNIQAKPSEMRFNSIEAELKLRANEIAQPIKTMDTDVLKSSLVTEKVSTEQICDDFITRLEQRNAIPEEIKVSSDSTVFGEK
ncbi:MAG: hypothetical protein WC556_12625 [Candidatus Methanoperedens sp.]